MYIANVQNKLVLDITGGKDEEHRDVIVYRRHGGKNQQWKIIYIDTIKKEKETGLNEDFGFHCDKPFFVRSRLPMKRVLEPQGANNVTIRKYNNSRRKQQTFTFNCVDKTIRSNYWKNYAMEIQSNGGSSNIRMTSTINGRWW